MHQTPPSPTHQADEREGNEGVEQAPRQDAEEYGPWDGECLQAARGVGWVNGSQACGWEGVNGVRACGWEGVNGA